MQCVMPFSLWMNPNSEGLLTLAFVPRKQLSLKCRRIPFQSNNSNVLMIVVSLFRIISIMQLHITIRYTYKLGHRLFNGSYIWSQTYHFKASPYPGQDSLQRVVIFRVMRKVGSALILWV